MILRVHESVSLAKVQSEIWDLPDIPTEQREEPEQHVVDWLGRIRLLQGVPFEYLVPDEGLLEPGTIRFFHLDRNWTDAMVDGAVSAGTVTNRDRREVQVEHTRIRARVDDAERAQWVEPPTTSDAPAPASGFLLRSRAVSGWPGLHVRATRTSRGRTTTLKVLRIERLAPAVLFALFDGIPTRVEIEEPRTGIQFGVRNDRFDDEPAGSWWLDVRNRDSGVELTPTQSVRVPFRRGSAGVIHLTELSRRLLAVDEADLGPTVPAGDRPDPAELDSAELALQLLRYPYQQAFEGAGESATGDLPGRLAEAPDPRLPWLEIASDDTSHTRADALLEMMRAFDD